MHGSEGSGAASARLEGLEAALRRLEAAAGQGATSCVTFGLPAAVLAEGVGRLRQELAAAAKIRSRL